MLVADKELVFQFFAVFSRFEYALKRSGYWRKRSAKNDAVETDWDAYANGLRGKFATVGVQAFQDARAFLERKPPKSQVAVDRIIDSKETVRGPGEFDERYTLRIVTTMRNNLFHGGKYPSGPVTDVARNRELIESCLVVLEVCLGLSPGVAEAFNEVA